MPRKRVSTPSRPQPSEDPNTGNDPVLALYWNYFSVARRAFEMVEVSSDIGTTLPGATKTPPGFTPSLMPLRALAWWSAADLSGASP